MEPREWMTVNQAAEWFGVHRLTVQEWYNVGKLNGYRLGNRAELDAFGRPGTMGARRIYKDEAARQLREERAGRLPS